MGTCYNKVLEFKKKYPSTICWRLKAHSKIIDKHLNSGEEIEYVFAGQKDLGYIDFFNTYVIALTNKRIMVVSKRVLFGYHFKSVTPDMYNDLTISKTIFWGKVIIDTVKEKMFFKYISAAALPEIETAITSYMMEEKRKYEEFEIVREKDEEDVK